MWWQGGEPPDGAESPPPVQSSGAATGQQVEQELHNLQAQFAAQQELLGSLKSRLPQQSVSHQDYATRLAAMRSRLGGPQQKLAKQQRQQKQQQQQLQQLQQQQLQQEHRPEVQVPESEPFHTESLSMDPSAAPFEVIHKDDAAVLERTPLTGGSMRDISVLEAAGSVPKKGRTSSFSEGTSLSKIHLLRKQLDENRTKFERQQRDNREKKASMDDMKKQLDKLRNELEQRDEFIHTFEKGIPRNSQPTTQQLCQQLLQKDAIITGLSSRIAELENMGQDQKERLEEKDCIIDARTEAVALVTKDRDEKMFKMMEDLDERQSNMRIMQQDFTIKEEEWLIDRESLTKLVTEKTGRVTQLEENCRRIESIRFELSARNAELQERIVTMQAERGDIQAEITCEKDKCFHLQNNVKELKQKLSKAEAHGSKKLKSLEKQLRSMKQDDAELSGESILDAHNQIAVLEEEKGNLQLRLVDFDELKAQNSVLEHSLVSMKKKILQISNNFDMQCNSISALENEKIKLVEVLNDRELKLFDLEINIVKFEEENQDLRENKIILNLKIGELELNLESSLEENKVLQQQVYEENKDRTEDETSVTEIRERLEQTVASLTEQLKTLTDQTLKQEDKVDKYKKLCRQAEEIQLDTSEANQRLLAILTDKEDTLTNQSIEIDKLNATVSDYQGQIDALNTCIDESKVEYEQSASSYQVQLDNFKRIIASKEIAIEKLIVNHSSEVVRTKSAIEEASVLRERLLSLRDHLAETEDELSDFRQDKSRLKQIIDQHDGLIQSLNDDITQLKRLIKTDNEKICQLRESVINLESKLITVEAEKSKIEDLIEDTAEKLSLKTKEIEKLDKDYANTKESLRECLADLQDRAMIVDNLTTENELLKQQKRHELAQKTESLSCVEEELLQKVQLLANLEQSYNVLRLSLAQAETDINIKDSNISEMQVTIANNVAEFAAKTSSLSRQEDVVNKLTSDCDGHKRFTDELNEMLASKEKSLAEQCKQIESLTVEISSNDVVSVEKDSKLTELTARLTDYETSTHTLENKIIQMTHSIASTESDVISERQKWASFEDQLREKDSGSEMLNKEIAENIIEISTLSEKFISKEIDLNEIAEKLTCKENEYDGLRGQFDQLSQWYEQVNSDCTLLQQQLQEATEQLLILQAQMHEKDTKLQQLEQHTQSAEILQVQLTENEGKVQEQLQQKESTEQELEQTTQHVELLKEEMKHLETKVQQLDYNNHQMEILQEQLHEKEAKLHELEHSSQKLQLLQEQLQGKEAKLQELEQDFQQLQLLKEQLQEKEAKVQELEQSSQKLQLLQEQLQEKEAKLQELEQSSQQLQLLQEQLQEKEAKVQELEQSSQQVQLLQEQLQEKEAKVQELEQSSQQLQLLQEQLQGRVGKVEDIKQGSQQLELLQEQLHEKEIKVHSLEQTAQHMHDIQRQLHEKETRVTELEEHIDLLVQEMEGKEKVIKSEQQRLEERAADLCKTDCEKQDKINQLTFDMEKLQAEMSSVMQYCDELQQCQARWEDWGKSVEGEKETLRQELEAARVELQHKSDLLDEAFRTKESLEKSVELLTNQLTEKSVSLQETLELKAKLEEDQTTVKDEYDRLLGRFLSLSEDIIGFHDKATTAEARSELAVTEVEQLKKRFTDEQKIVEDLRQEIKLKDGIVVDLKKQVSELEDNRNSFNQEVEQHQEQLRRGSSSSTYEGEQPQSVSSHRSTCNCTTSDYDVDQQQRNASRRNEDDCRQLQEHCRVLQSQVDEARLVITQLETSLATCGAVAAAADDEEGALGEVDLRDTSLSSSPDVKTSIEVVRLQQTLAEKTQMVEQMQEHLRTLKQNKHSQEEEIALLGIRMQSYEKSYKEMQNGYQHLQHQLQIKSDIANTSTSKIAGLEEEVGALKTKLQSAEMSLRKQVLHQHECQYNQYQVQLSQHLSQQTIMNTKITKKEEQINELEESLFQRDLKVKELEAIISSGGEDATPTTAGDDATELPTDSAEPPVQEQLEVMQEQQPTSEKEPHSEQEQLQTPDQEPHLEQEQLQTPDQELPLEQEQLPSDSTSELQFKLSWYEEQWSTWTTHYNQLQQNYTEAEAKIAELTLMIECQSGANIEQELLQADSQSSKNALLQSDPDSDHGTEEQYADYAVGGGNSALVTAETAVVAETVSESDDRRYEVLYIQYGELYEHYQQLQTQHEQLHNQYQELTDNKTMMVQKLDDLQEQLAKRGSDAPDAALMEPGYRVAAELQQSPAETAYTESGEQCDKSDDGKQAAQSAQMLESNRRTPDALSQASEPSRQQSEHSELEEARPRAHQQHTQSQARQEQPTRRVTELELMVESAETEIARLREQLLLQQEERRSLTGRLHALEAELSAADTTTGHALQLRHDQRLERENSTLRSELEVMEGEHSRRTAEIDILETDNGRLRTDVEMTTHATQILEMEKESLLMEIQRLHDTRDDASRAMQASAEMSADARDQISRLQQQLADMQQQRLQGDDINVLQDDELDWGSEGTKEVEHSQQSSQDSSRCEQIDLLKQQLISMEKEKNGLSDELQASKVKCGKLLQKLKTYQAKYEHLQKDVDRLKSMKGGLSDLDQALEDEFKAQVSQAQTERDELKQRLDTVLKEKDQVTKQCEVLKDAHGELIEMKESQDSSISLLRSRLKQMESEVSSMEWKIVDLEGALSDQQEGVEIKEHATHPVKDTYRPPEDVKQLKDQIIALENQLDELSSSNMKIESLNKDLNGRLSELEDANQVLSQEKLLLEEGRTQLENDKVKANKDVSVYKEAFIQQQEQFEKLTEEKSSLDRELEEVQYQLQSLTSDYNALYYEMAESRKDQAAMKYEHTRLEGERDRAVYDMEVLSAELEAFRQDNLEDTVRSLEEQITALRETCMALKEEETEQVAQQAALQDMVDVLKRDLQFSEGREHDLQARIHKHMLEQRISSCDLVKLEKNSQYSQAETAALQSKIARLVQEAQAAEREAAALQEQVQHWRQQSQHLSKQVESADMSLSRLTEREAGGGAELQAALASLHLRDLRCHQLILEINKLVEERDTLQLRLSSSLRTTQELARQQQQQGTSPGQAGAASQEAGPLRHKLDELRELNDEVEQKTMASIPPEPLSLPPSLPPSPFTSHTAPSSPIVITPEFTLTRETQATSSTLIDWIMGRATPRVMHV